MVLGRFVGFVVGMSTSSLFTKVVYEKRGVGNLFGLAGRKKVVVNSTPEWMQTIISIIIGFIVLELANYFFKNKIYLPIWDFIKSKLNKDAMVKESSGNADGKPEENYCE